MTSSPTTECSWSDVSRWHPLVALLVWGAVVVVIAMIAQLGALAFGSEWRVWSSEGHQVLFVASMFGWLAMASLDPRPLSTFGLAIGERWPRHLLVGVVLGAGVPFAYLSAATALGAYGPVEDASWWRLWTLLYIVPYALITAYLQQIALSGYVLGIFRSRLGWFLALLVTGVLFVFLHRCGHPLFDEPTYRRKLVGLVLLGMILGGTRLLTGNIIASGAIYAGFLIVRKMNHETGMVRQPLDMHLHLDGDPTTQSLAILLAPFQDMLESRVMWMILGTILLVGMLALLIRGAPQPSGDGRIARSLKRIYPLGMINCMAPIDVWLAQLNNAKWRVPPVYWPRLVMTLGCSALASVLAIPERALTAAILRKRSAPAPVFILGVHRSGTTHLQNLLALDRNLAPARTFHVMNPHAFISLGWILAPIVAIFMPWRRPMDRVRYGLFAPNEEEFAMMNVSGLSPHWGMTFPHQWEHYDRCIDPRTLPEKEQRDWEHHYVRFVTRLTAFTKRRPLLKNPYNTARLGVLRRLFPDAVFIHLHRDPFTVVQSNRHLANEGHVLMQVQDPRPGDDYGSRFLQNYRLMEETFDRDRAEAVDARVAEVSFEQIEQDALETVRRVYEQLALPFTGDFECRLRKYLAGLQGYRKNRHRDLDEDTRRAVEEVMGTYVKRWGYAQPASHCP